MNSSPGTSDQTFRQHNPHLPETYVAKFHDRAAVERMVYRPLGSTGISVSTIGLGAAHVCDRRPAGVGSHSPTTPDAEDENDKVALSAIREAIRLGINFIDTSPFYGNGQSENIVGQALTKVPREAYYLATKAGRGAGSWFDFSARAIRASVEQSLKKLSVNYIDLLQLHDVEFGDENVILNEALPELERLQAEGRIRFIGITGYPLDVLKSIIEKSSVRIDTVLSYCRRTLFDRTLDVYLSFFESRKVGVINAAVLGMGLYSEQIPYWHPAPQSIKDACQAATKIAKSLNVDICRLALHDAIQSPNSQFTVVSDRNNEQEGNASQNDAIACHLIGIESPSMARKNIEAIRNPLSAHECDALERIRSECFPVPNMHWEGMEPQRYRANPDEFRRFLSGVQKI